MRICPVAILLPCIMTVMPSFALCESGYREAHREIWSEYFASDADHQSRKQIRDARLTALAGGEKIACPIEVPEHINPPDEHHEINRLILLADGGNAEACLQLAIKRTPRDSRLGWLRKAAALNRPGALFLVGIFDTEGWPKRNIRIEDDVLVSRQPPNPETLAGYDEFIRQIAKGDSVLYDIYNSGRELYMNLAPHIHDEQFNEIYRKGLLAKLDGDNPEIRLQLAKTMDISPETRDGAAFLSAAKRKIWMDSQQRELEWCLKAAEAGNLEAMQFWLMYCLPMSSELTRDNRDRIFRYVSRLVRSGDPAFLHFGDTAEEIVNSYYGDQVMESWRAQWRQRIAEDKRDR